MLDRILKVSRHLAYMIFLDGRIVTLSSDRDVDEIIQIVLRNNKCTSNSEILMGSLEDTIRVA